MKIHAGLILLASVLLSSCAAPSQPPISQSKSNVKPVHSQTIETKPAYSQTIAQNGQAKLPIAVSAKASAATRAVANDLKKYLDKITGAKFEIKTGGGTKGIVVGTLAEFPHPELEKPLELRGAYDGLEAYAIRTNKDRVLLTGRTEKGVSHAAYRFLELLGCRWFFQAPEWEVIPTRRTLTFAHNETSRPAILARRIWYGYGYFNDPDKGILDSRPYLEHLQWDRRNRLGESVQVNAGHAWQTIISTNAEAFAQHPEYLALVDGKRQTKEVLGTSYPEIAQLCVSQPEVRRLVREYALQYFQQNPQADMISVDPSDTAAHCECKNCKKLGSVSNRVFGLANEVAREVAKKYPGKLVGLLAYSTHSEPPTFELEPNVFVQLTAGFTTGKYSFEELLELWPKKCDHMGYYEYFSVWQWDWDMPPGGRAADIRLIRSRIKTYAQKNALAFDAESSNNWGPHGRGYYLASKLLWNPDADVDAVLRDFYEKAFGPAAAPMQRYYERLDPGNNSRKGEGLYALAFRDLHEASTLAKDRPDVLARLRQLKEYMRYVQLRWMFDRVPKVEKENRKALALEILKHVYRTRYSYMNHWRAIETSWSGNIGNEVGAPEWFINDPTPKPWIGTPPYTDEEVESLFAEGLNYFKPAPQMGERKFSSDYVPVKFPNRPTLQTSQYSMFPVRYVLYGGPQKPIRIKVLTSTTRVQNKPEAKYSLIAPHGNTITEGSLPQDTRTHELELKVPNSGTYVFEFNDQGTGWSFDIPEDQPYGLLLPGGDYNFNVSYGMSMYFYVPKGTKELNLYVGQGVPFDLLRPDGKTAKAISAEGGYCKISTNGMDGDLWSFKGTSLYNIHLLNAPNILSASPRTVLVPREVARQDKLDVIP